MSLETNNPAAGDQALSPYGYMPDIVLPSGEVVGLSPQAQLFLRHQVLPFAYNAAEQEAANLPDQNPPAVAI